MLVVSVADFVGLLTSEIVDEPSDVLLVKLTSVGELVT